MLRILIITGFHLYPVVPSARLQLSCWEVLYFLIIKAENRLRDQRPLVISYSQDVEKLEF